MAILLLMYGLALSSMVKKSPTFDEQYYITRGLGYLRGLNQHLRVGHPLGQNALNAALLVSDEGVKLPLSDPSWQGTDFHRPSELFLWELGNDVEYIMFLARLPSIWLGMLMAAVGGRWAKELGRSRSAGVMAVALLALDPNILAHARLATTDIGPAAGAVFAGYTLWRYTKRPTWGNVLLAGAAFGLLQDTKSSAVVFIPLFAVVILSFLLLQWRRPVTPQGVNSGVAAESDWQKEPRSMRSILVKSLLAYPFVAFLTLWAANGFQFGRLPQDLVTNVRWSEISLPLANHVEQLLYVSRRLERGSPAFLLGAYSERGWWYYFPAAFALKTPLTTLGLLAWAFVIGVRSRLKKNDPSRNRHQVIDYCILLIPSLGFFAIALTSKVNIGYRYLLPALPFLTVFLAVSFGNRSSSKATLRLSRLLVALLAVSTIRIHPHFLAYFNLIAGGPDKGWRTLVDSNIDWGQDLGGLKQWMVENNVPHVWLSYFGEASPEHYDIAFTGLDSYSPRYMNPEARPFYPRDPAPGVYAISATNLQGVQFADHNQFAWFREKVPAAKIGYSIFVYRVPKRGEQVDLLLGGVQLDEIESGTYGRFQTNDVIPHWFKPDESLLFRRDAWMVLGRAEESYPVWSAIGSTLFEQVTADEVLTLYKSKPIDPEQNTPMAVFTDGSGEIWLTTVGEPQIDPVGRSVYLTTVWEKRTGPQPVKIFIHITGADGTMIAQWDGLGATWEGWRAEDILIQAHSFNIPTDAPGIPLEVWAGLYHPESLTRWQTGDDDRVYLGALSVEQSQ